MEVAAVVGGGDVGVLAGAVVAVDGGQDAEEGEVAFEVGLGLDGVVHPFEGEGEGDAEAEAEEEAEAEVEDGARADGVGGVLVRGRGCGRCWFRGAWRG